MSKSAIKSKLYEEKGVFQGMCIKENHFGEFVFLYKQGHYDSARQGGKELMKKNK